MPQNYERPFLKVLTKRLDEPRTFIQIVSGPRQVGKTTLVRQALDQCASRTIYASADEPTLRDGAWLRAQWDAARLTASDSEPSETILTIDEVQKIPNWSETVKRLWDEDTASGMPLKVVLLGSSPLLIQTELTESLAGRFEQSILTHWSFSEMEKAFGASLDDYLLYGGYPGAAQLADNPDRWRRYVLDSLVETTISRDVLLQRRVDKPALLRRLFELGCLYSGQVLSYTKMIGQLQDAGNTTTLAHYLDLLSGVGMLKGISKYAGETVRQRASSPKLQVYNTALMTAVSGSAKQDLMQDREFRGRLTESAVGAHLVNAELRRECEVSYWRERDREVDYVIRGKNRLVALEVKSGRKRADRQGLEAFDTSFRADRLLIVGGDGIPLEEFLSSPVDSWLD
jgi:predicted AAA+ superfamily ATPase